MLHTIGLVDPPDHDDYEHNLRGKKGSVAIII